MTIIHESDVPEVQHPGRSMRWLANEDSLQANNLSCCVIRVQPGEAVRPAHSHPKSEELIYIMSGHGNDSVVVGGGFACTTNYSDPATAGSGFDV